MVKDVDERTSAHVPKRQAEQSAREAAKDFEAFYAQRPANDLLGANTLLAGSSDAKGVRMLPKALREATRKAAEAEKAAAVRGDPMAQKKLRPHDKRMAAVAAVWQQEPLQRTADDIVAELQRTPPPRHPSPSCRGPRTSACGQAWRRACRPRSARCSTSSTDVTLTVRGRATVLVDGEEDQLTAIFDHARSHRRS